MKNSRFAKLIAVFLSLVLIVGATVAIMAVADNADAENPVTTEDVGILSYNANYAARTELVFAVADNEYAESKNRTVYLLFFKNAQSDNATGAELYSAAASRKTADETLTASEFYTGENWQNKEYSSLTVGEKALVDSGAYIHIFYSDGINASDIGTTQYVVPVIKETESDKAVKYTIGYSKAENADDENGGTEKDYSYATRPVSVAGYAVEKYLECVDTGKTDTAQASLYLNILSFGKAAADKSGKPFNIDLGTSYCLIVNGAIGKTGNETVSTRFETTEGSTEELFLRAEAKNPNGEYFLCWQDIFGNVITTNRLITKAETSTEGTDLTAYIAVYGDKALSPYMTTPDLESAKTEQVLSKDKTSNNIGGFVLRGATSGDYAINAWVTGEDGGDKSVVMQRDEVKDGISFGDARIENTSVSGANVFEIDFKQHTLKTGGTRLMVRNNYYWFGVLLNVKEVSGENSYTISFAAWNTTAAGAENGAGVALTPEGEAGTAKTYKFSKDETITIKIVMDTSGDVPVARVGINNVLYMTATGALEADDKYAYGHFRGIYDYEAGCDATISSAQIFSNKQNYSKYEYDNLTIRKEIADEFED